MVARYYPREHIYRAPHIPCS